MSGCGRLLASLCLALTACHPPHGLPGSDGEITDYIETGREIYLSACASCHLEDGAGLPGLNPPLRGSSFVNGDPAPLAAIMLNGLRGPIEVNGQSFNGLMPMWKDVLTDPQIAAVLTYLRHAWGNEAAAIAATDIASVRLRLREKSDFFTLEELQTFARQKADLSTQPPTPVTARPLTAWKDCCLPPGRRFLITHRR